MQHLEAQKVVAITPPAVIVDNAAFTTAAVDTRGFSELLVVVHFGALDIALAALKLQESDASNMSGAVDIVGADFSVLPLVLPVDTVDNTFIVFHLRTGGGRKRYVDLVVTGGDGSAGTYMTAIAILGKGSTVPTTAAARGAGTYISIS